MHLDFVRKKKDFILIPLPLSLTLLHVTSYLTKVLSDGHLGCFQAFAVTNIVTTDFTYIRIYVHARMCLQDAVLQVDLKVQKVCKLLHVYWKIFPHMTVAPYQ